MKSWFLFIFCFIETLDELTDLLVKLFAEVKNKNVPVPEFPENPFTQQYLKVRDLGTNMVLKWL